MTNLDISQNQLVTPIKDTGGYRTVVKEGKRAMSRDEIRRSVVEEGTLTGVVMSVFYHKGFLTKVFFLDLFASKKFWIV